MSQNSLLVLLFITNIILCNLFTFREWEQMLAAVLHVLKVAPVTLTGITSTTATVLPTGLDSTANIVRAWFINLHNQFAMI